MRVIATARGYDNLKTREIDEEFDMPDGSTGSWFRSIEDNEDEPKPKAKGPKSDKPPKTMSEHAEKSDERPAY